jgi:hypothetical protein
MRNTEKVRHSAAPNLLVQFPLAELTLQLAVDPSKSRRSIPVRADGRSQQKPTVNPSKSRRLIPTDASPVRGERLATYLEHDVASRLAREGGCGRGQRRLRAEPVEEDREREVIPLVAKLVPLPALARV